MAKKCFSLACIFGWIVLSAPSLVQAAPLTYTPSRQEVLVGNTVQVELRIAGLGDMRAPSLGAFDLTTQLLQPGVLSFSSVTFGNELGASLQDSALTRDRAQIFGVSFESPEFLNTHQPGEFRLATFTLAALTLGTTNFTIPLIGEAVLADAFGNRLPIDRVTPAAVTVTPEPGAFVLLGTFLALGLLFSWRLRRRGA
jgi:hypothetical protein